MQLGKSKCSDVKHLNGMRGELWGTTHILCASWIIDDVSDNVWVSSEIPTMDTIWFPIINSTYESISMYDATRRSVI